jgi:hypothetical protein
VNYRFRFEKVLLLAIKFLVVASTLGYSVVHSQGLYPIISNFPPQTYSAPNYPSSPQNFCIVQDRIGRLFVSNANGVLVYDGGKWDMIEATRNKKFFKLAVDAKGRVFSGGEGELGYFTADFAGRMSFMSLRTELPDSVQDFSRITRVDFGAGKIWFLGGTNLFAWDGKRFTIWSGVEDFSRVFSDGEKVFVRTDSELLELVNEDLVPVEYNDKIKSRQIRGIFPQPNHLPDQPDLIIVTSTGGVYNFRANELKLLNPGLDSIAVFNGKRLPNGLIALGTNGKGLYLLDEQGEVVQIIDESTGLLQDQVVYMMVDREMSLWMALFSGLSRIEYLSPTGTIDKADGLKPLTLGMYQSEKDLNIGTIEGWYVLAQKLNKSKQVPVVRYDLNTKEVLGFVVYPDELIAVGSEGIFSSKGGGPPKINNRIRTYCCFR